MNYQEVQDYLFSQLPMYQRQGVSAFKKNLDNIIALCEVLGNPQEQFRSIHIAGTNGKGSVSHIMAAGLQANGYSVGMYSSPHYKDYRERIKINAQLIPEQEVISFVENHRSDFDRIQPSFFEITVAMAFQHFANQKVDVAIIETGLGGRLDSTNIISPLLSVITNISMDHQSMLGDTLTQIAGEKAGIIKPGIPVVIGEYQDEIHQVFLTKAKEEGSDLTCASHDCDLDQTSKERFHFSIKGNDWNLDFEAISPAPYQLKNYRTALYALYHLQSHFDLHVDTVSEGLADMTQLTYYIGRWMKVQDHPTVIVDSAHNEAGIQHLTEKLSEMDYDHLHIVFGAASDKDLDSIFRLLPANATYYWAKADIPRGMDIEVHKEKGDRSGLSGYTYPNVPAAFRNAVATASKDDLVIVAGSIFVVAEVI